MDLSARCVITVFGTNCVGKSTVSLALAQRLIPCAVVRVDDLRRMISDASTGHDGVDESLIARESREFYLAAENAWLVARNLVRNGFSVVIDGLPQSHCRRTFVLHGRSVLRVGLYCEIAVIESRRLQRGWTGGTPASLNDTIEWYRNNLGSFECLIDTGAVPLERTVDSIVASLEVAPFSL
jgi:predicted kinase